jgi:hypothetical protein
LRVAARVTCTEFVVGVTKGQERDELPSLYRVEVESVFFRFVGLRSACLVVLTEKVLDLPFYNFKGRANCTPERMEREEREKTQKRGKGGPEL